MTGRSLQELERSLGHEFARPELLEAALVHRSYTSEHPETEDNERLEFLGDAVLQLVVTEFLFREFGELAEGEMAKVRAACVNREELAGIAARIGLGPHLAIGVGEESSGGREKPSILADSMEAVIAAVYLDAGLEAARRVIMELWADLIRRKAQQPGGRDYKTRYQELLAASGQRPVYEVADEGPDHAKVFNATVTVDGEVRGRGRGRSKKEAEQQAARDAMQSEQPVPRTQGS